MVERMMGEVAMSPEEIRAEKAELVIKLTAIDAELADVQHALNKWGLPNHKEDVGDVRQKLHGMHHYYEDDLIQQS